jgi:hypothetical protein
MASRKKVLLKVQSPHLFLVMSSETFKKWAFADFGLFGNLGYHPW